MGKKIVVVLEILAIFVATIWCIFAEVIPEYKEKLGSSDKFIRPDAYSNMLEIQVDNVTSFAILLDKDTNIFHLMFFDKEAICLYNQNIEGKSLQKGLLSIIKILIENDYLKNTSIVTVTRYNDKDYEKCKRVFVELLSQYGLNTNIIEKSNTLKEKAKELGIDASNNEDILKKIDLYSKEYPRLLNNIDYQKENENLKLTEETSKKFTNQVYRKIEEYVEEEHISYLDKNNTVFEIQLIPADNHNQYFPSNRSWYYVSEGRVFAYIEIVDGEKQYGYCYQGSIDKSIKGEC